MRTLFYALLLLLFLRSAEAGEALGFGTWVDNSPTGGVDVPVLSSTAGAWSAAPLVAMAPAGGGRVYGILRRAAAGDPLRLDLAVISDRGVRPFATLPTPWRPSALVVARDGTIYVLADTADTTNDSILVLSPQGTLLRRWELDWPFYGTPDRTSPLDLNADQCTLVLHGLDARIRQFDACSGTFRPELPSHFPGGDHRLLPDGRLLIAFSNEVRIYEMTGALVRRYFVPMPFNLAAVALADEGRSVLLIQDAWEEPNPDRNVIRKLNLATGAITPAGALAIHEPRGLVAIPAWTAALAPSHATAADVPLAMPAVLLVFAAVLALFGVKYSVIA